MNLSDNKKRHKPLSVFALVMINVIAVDSLRNLTIGAEFGFALMFFYTAAALLFFVPTILITAELATGWPVTGGSYVWIREAFGPRLGFFSIWLQWIYNVVWYPTIFAFIGGVLAYLIDPQLVDNKFYMLGVILVSFWIMTFINCAGLKTSSLVSTIGAIFGTILPMLLIAILGGLWLYWHNVSHINFSLASFWPQHADLKNLAFLTNILFGLMGMEMSAVHAGDVANPKRDYPRALFYSTFIILATLMFSSLAISIVIPAQELNLVSGLIDAFKIFFETYHLGYLVPVMAVLIVVGSLSGAGAWIIGPARGLLVASEDNDLPRFLQKMNNRKMPVGILITQGVIVTLLCSAFFIMPTVKSSYWLLSNLTAQLALMFYILLFAAAIRLHHSCSHVERAFKIPGGSIGIWLVSGTGIITCVVAIIVGFLPPQQVGVVDLLKYEIILSLGIIACCLPPFLFCKRSKTSLAE
ncbi:MAG TPA: APC family permease [Gammaproteobacteria bacterium]|nr:APC family permease [Gammaproteobacteria bacterium]